MIKNYKLLLEYDGARYHGWQKQKHTDATIQGKLEALLFRMTGKELEIQGAGRTDAGVHARGQVANFKAAWEDFLPQTQEELKKLSLQGLTEVEAIRQYMNRFLPNDIYIRQLSEVDLRFHSRLSAKEKQYCYRIRMSEHAAVFSGKYETLIAETLDIEAMKDAAKLLVGRHDFKAFSANRRTKKSTERILYGIRFVMAEPDLLEIFYDGNGFLYNMVRIMTGTLLEIGMGKRSADSIANALRSGSREDAGYTAPAMGLMLMSVRYDLDSRDENRNGGNI